MVKLRVVNRAGCVMDAMFFGEPEELQKQLLAPNEIILTTDAVEGEIKDLLENIDQITEIDVDVTESEFTVAHIKSAHEDIYELSSAVFRAFAASKKVIYEMTLKKGNLEDIFIELSETAETQAIEQNEIMEDIIEESGVDGA